MGSKEINVIEKIDGKDVDEITKEDRMDWASKLCQKIEGIDGVESAQIVDGDRTYNSVLISIMLESRQVGEYYDISPNLRSLSQKMIHLIKNDEFAGINIVSPEITSKPTKKGEYYDGNFYRVEVSYP